MGGGSVADSSVDDGAVEVRTEERMTRMIILTRVGTASFVYLPLLGWGRLGHPSVAVGAALAATAEAVWFTRRARRGRCLPKDTTLVLLDAVFCVALMAVGSRAAAPARRNVVMTELVPFSLASPAAIGFGLGLRPLAVAVVAAEMLTWSLSVLPDVTTKLASDLTGFALWYLIGTLIARELRDLARRTARAQRRAAEVSALLAAQDTAMEVARQRDRARAVIHDRLLPVVERLRAGRLVDDALAREARRAARHARQFVLDGEVGERQGFAASLIEVRETFTDAGMALDDVFRVEGDPPAEIAQAVLAAAREALNNVARHVGTGEPVHFYAHSTAGAVEIVIRDRGQGFDPATAARRGGLGATFEAVRRRGGWVTLDAALGRGTKVVIAWPAAVSS